MKKIFLVLVLFFCCFFSKAQENVVYVAPGETFNWIVPAENGDTIVFQQWIVDTMNLTIEDTILTVYTNVVPFLMLDDYSFIYISGVFINNVYIDGCINFYIRRKD